MNDFDLSKKLIEVAKISEEIRRLDKVIGSEKCVDGEFQNCIRSAIEQNAEAIDPDDFDGDVWLDVFDACAPCQRRRDAWILRKELRIKRGRIKSAISRHGNFLYKKQRNLGC